MEFVEEREKPIDEQEKEMEEMKKMHFEEMLDLERESDYFWYLTDITIGAGDRLLKTGDRLLKTGDYPFLTIWSDGLVLHVFVNGQLASNIKKNDQSFSCLIL